MRHARPSDAPAIAQFMRQAARDGFSIAEEADIDERKVAADLVGGIGLRIVAERGPEVVGVLEVVPGERRSMRRTGRLQMVVSEALRGRGIGAELLRYAVSWAEAGAVDRIETFVRADNPRTIELYRRFGLVEEGRLRQRMLFGDQRVDVVVMGRLFGEAAR